MTLYRVWKIVLKTAMGSMKNTTTSASCQSSRSIRTRTTAKVTKIWPNQIRPKPTNRRIVEMSAIARDSSCPDCQLS